MKVNCFLLLALLLHTSLLTAQEKKNFIPFIHAEHHWVDSVFQKMSPKERIAQLFMIRAHTNLGQAYSDSVAKVIKKEQLGGIVLFQGGPVRHVNLINHYQALSKVPLWIAMDGEWGLGMRMPDSTRSFPYQMTLGAIQEDSLLYQMGQEIGKDFKRMGIHINFAPVVDVNNNPRNPVINYRSFGENKDNVARKANAYMQGMMNQGILSSLKHFPGHGDTDVDSHQSLPTLNFSKERLHDLEFYPFKALINQGAPGVMVAHLSIPSLDNTLNLPSSLSKPIITGLLKEELSFKGLIFTDAMDMKGLVNHFTDGEAEVRAIIAGNDVLELAENSKLAIRMIQKAIRKKRLNKNEVESKVKKVLAAKYWLGLNRRQRINTENLVEELHRPEAEVLNQTLADHAITQLIDEQAVKNLKPSARTAIISVGVDQVTTFQQELQAHYSDAMNFILPSKASTQDLIATRAELKKYDQLILALHDTRSRPASSLAYNDALKQFIQELSSKSITCLFANPYTLLQFPGIEKSNSLIVAYQNDEALQKAAVKVILQKTNAKGKLPVSINTHFQYGDGL